MVNLQGLCVCPRLGKCINSMQDYKYHRTRHQAIQTGAPTPISDLIWCHLLGLMQRQARLPLDEEHVKLWRLLPGKFMEMQPKIVDGIFGKY